MIFEGFRRVSKEKSLAYDNMAKLNAYSNDDLVRYKQKHPNIKRIRFYIKKKEGGKVLIEGDVDSVRRELLSGSATADFRNGNLQIDGWEIQAIK